MLSKKLLKKLIHKISIKLLDQILKEKKIYKTFPRYKLRKNYKNINSLVGWIPFIKDKTKLQLFNFFLSTIR